jgi:hypothetical protein
LIPGSIIVSLAAVFVRLRQKKMRKHTSRIFSSNH